MEHASQLRERILPHHQVSVRKTFGLNEPGCSVNCNYCTLGEQYVGHSNRNRIVDGIEERISRFQNIFPIHNLELVGYWYGISSPYSTEFQRLVSLKKNIVRSVNDPIVGGDLGIISNPQIFSYLRDAGITYIHNNLETSSRLYPIAIGISTSHLHKKLETLKLANKSGLTTTSGILIGLGEGIDDLIEQIRMLRRLPLRRIAVNFMDYETDPRIGERFANVRNQLTNEYALHILVFLRNYIHPNQSLMVGSGVGRYMYDERTLTSLLGIVDTLHLGCFINLRGYRQTQVLGEEEYDLQSAYQLVTILERFGYTIVSPPYFKEMF